MNSLALLHPHPQFPCSSEQNWPTGDQVRRIASTHPDSSFPGSVGSVSFLEIEQHRISVFLPADLRDFSQLGRQREKPGFLGTSARTTRTEGRHHFLKASSFQARRHLSFSASKRPSATHPPCSMHPRRGNNLDGNIFKSETYRGRKEIETCSISWFCDALVLLGSEFRKSSSFLNAFLIASAALVSFLH